jgi:integrase
MRASPAPPARRTVALHAGQMPCEIRRPSSGATAPKFFVNFRNLLHVIVGWARHPSRGYLAHDPVAGLERIRLPDEGAAALRTRPGGRALEGRGRVTPDDAIIAVTLLSATASSSAWRAACGWIPTWHREHLVPLLEQVKIRLPRTSLHSLRHTYVSLLIAQGEDARYIADQVGHSTVRLTQDLYAHVFGRTRVAATRRLDRWGNPRWAHNPKVVGSNPTPATKEIKGLGSVPEAL